MSTFLISPAPVPFEGQRSYVSRMARANRALFAYCDILGSVEQTARAFPEFTELLTPEQDWQVWTRIGKVFCMDDGRLAMDQGRVYPGVFRQDVRAICPRCLRERRFAAPFAWEFKVVRGCRRHRRELLTACPRCLRPFKWHDHSLTDCPCGHALETEDSRQLSPASHLFVDLFHDALHLSVADRPPAWHGVLESAHKLSLEWLLLLFDVLIHVLFPQFLRSNYGQVVRRYGVGAIDDAVLELLDDEDYVFGMRGAVFLEAARDPFTLEKATTPGASRDAVRARFGAALEELPCHPAFDRLRYRTSTRWKRSPPWPYVLAAPRRRTSLAGEIRARLIPASPRTGCRAK